MGIIATNTTLDHIEEDDKQRFNLGLRGKAPWLVSEAGLYSLVLKSRKPEVKAFSRWVTKDVLLRSGTRTSDVASYEPIWPITQKLNTPMTVSFIDGLDAPPPECILDILKDERREKGGGIWSIGNELKPSDIYCYLFAKYGPPNGMQNFLRTDDSDNLIHWDWALVAQDRVLLVMGLNMRTEVHLMGAAWDFKNCKSEDFVSQVKSDFAKYGKQMSEFRQGGLEDWDLFVNPYKQLRNAIDQLNKDLGELKLDPTSESLENPRPGEVEAFQNKWNSLTARYDRGVGLAMAIRAMNPVLAESFINLLLFILCRPDIKGNERLYSATVRANIDIKIQSLHINCIGFKTPVDWSSKECSEYNSVVNERNDMLHGNVVPEKQKFAEIFFNGKVPVFKRYESFWQHGVGVSISSSGLSKVSGDLTAVDNFIEYVLSCLHDGIRAQIEQLIHKRDIGLNKKTKRVGALLPDHITDFQMVFDTGGKAAPNEPVPSAPQARA